MKTYSPVVAFIDIETSPMLGYVWKTYEADVIKVERDWYIMSFAVKFNNGKTKCFALPDFEIYKSQPNNDLEIVKKLWEVFDKADVIVGQNGDAFDIKKSNARFIFHGMTPPSPYKTIDTLKVARKNFKFTSNRLGELGEYLGLGKKEETGGFKLWDQCLQGDMKAWAKMKKYNKRDVDLLEAVYLRLRPWVKNVRLNIFAEGTCPSCMSTSVQRRGYDSSNSLWYQRFRCNDCSAWFRGQSLGKVKPALNAS